MTIDELRTTKGAVAITPVDVYRCPVCHKAFWDDDEDYDAEESAKECCPFTASRDYGCSACKEVFFRYSEAEKHITEECTKVGIADDSEPDPEEWYLDALRFSGRHPVDLQAEYRRRKEKLDV